MLVIENIWSITDCSQHYLVLLPLGLEMCPATPFFSFGLILLMDLLCVFERQLKKVAIFTITAKLCVLELGNHTASLFSAPEARKGVNTRGY